MVLKGAISEAGLPAVLAQLADGGSSGCLHVKDAVGEQAKVYLRSGRVYSVVAPGRSSPALGSRLVSSGDLAPESLADAIEAQRTELQGWRLGELLVHLGYVEQPVVEAFVQEQLRSAMADLLVWDEGTWRFRVNERTREDVATPVEVAELLAEVERRRESWQAIRAQVPGGSSVPVLASAGNTEAELAIDPDAWSLLCKVDGLRTVAELARDGGFTLYEAAGVVSTLVTAGLVEVLAPPADEPAETVEPAGESVEPAVPAALMAAFAPGDRSNREDEPPAPGAGRADENVEDTLHRVSDSLSAMLGPGRPGEDLFAAFAKPPLPETGPDQSQVQLAEEREALRRRDVARRPGDAAELLAAQAELEAARNAALAAQTTGPAETPDAIVVDLAARRALGRPVDPDGAHEDPTEDAVEAERAEAERIEAERAEAERIGTERAEAERAENMRAETERVENERAEAERVQTERVEAERAEAERAETERAEAERAEARTSRGQIPSQPPSPEDDVALATQARAELFEASYASEASEAPTADTRSDQVDQDAAPTVAAYEPEDDSPVWAGQDTDTASLLRELSSVGFDDDEPDDQETRPVARHPVGAPLSKQKKKGLFGRG